MQHEEVDGSRVDVRAIGQRTAHCQQLLPAVAGHHRLLRADLPVHGTGLAFLGPGAAPLPRQLGVLAVAPGQE
ncbi:hypothetical protein D3C73_1328150 [compost metagenome]